MTFTNAFYGTIDEDLLEDIYYEVYDGLGPSRRLLESEEEGERRNLQGGMEQYYAELVTCQFPGVCPDGVVRDTCQWFRSLGVYGLDAAALGAYDFGLIYVYTNGMPDHCYYTQSNSPVGSSSLTTGLELESYAIAMRWNTPIADMAKFAL